MVSKSLIRFVALLHFLLLSIGTGLFLFSSPKSDFPGWSDGVQTAGRLGIWVGEVVNLCTPAIWIAMHLGGTGFTKPLKVLSQMMLVLVLISIAVGFWGGYGAIFSSSMFAAGLEAESIAAVIMFSLDFVVVILLMILAACQPTATVYSSSRSTSTFSVLLLISDIAALGVLLGVIFLWTMVESSLNVDDLVSGVGMFLSYLVWTAPAIILVIRGREDGLLTGDIVWNFVLIITQAFVAVFAGIIFNSQVFTGMLHNLDPRAACAVAFAIFFLLILVGIAIQTVRSRRKSSSGPPDAYSVYGNANPYNQYNQ